MLRLDFTNVFAVSQAHGLTKEQLTGAGKHIKDFRRRLEARGQDFYRVLDDGASIRSIKRFAQVHKKRFSDVVVLGIGGSALGALCLKQSLTHLFADELPRRSGPRVHILDNIDPVLIREIEDVITIKRTLFIVVTKSGSTPETLAQYFYFRNRLAKAGAKVNGHFVFVTDPEKGFLREVASREGIQSFSVPPGVGGRFSVLTSVGLLPGAFLGLDVVKLISGAREMRNRLLSGSFSENYPFQLAAVQYLLAQKGKTINVLMPYAQKLIRFADWYRQLLAESIGKARNEQGEIVNVGITPVPALGVTDQHSQSQLYNEGPNDKLIMFMAVASFGKRLPIPEVHRNESALAFLKGTSFNELIDVERQGTAAAYTENYRPNLTITIDRIDEAHLGELFMLFEGATAYLGEFYGINAFDQPGVERAKQVTKELLLNKT